MPELPSARPPATRRRSALLWDLAGTLVTADLVDGRAGLLPDGAEHLPELARDFRLIVTTGDTALAARRCLRGFGVLPYFEAVYGALWGPGGKPYGAILRQLEADPRLSLAIGDRPGADLPADTDELVTILVNQFDDVVGAGFVAALIRRLRGRAPEFPAAFDALLADAVPTPGAEGDWQGGTVVRAGWARGEASVSLRVFRHPALPGERRLIVC